MLKELDAIAFEHQITFESRTHPWIVLAKGRDFPPEPYVVKLFTKDEVEKNYSVAKEVFANIIANHLEISTPEAALINLNNYEFVNTLSVENTQIVSVRDYRIKFGSRYINGTLPFNSNLPLDFYDQFENLDSAFAFDSLIRNTDRTVNKPDNIRFKDGTHYLIDHEYSLDITKEIITEFDKNNWVYSFSNHVLYYCLLLQKNKTGLFGDFERKLEEFDPNVLDSYEEQLRSHHYNPPYKDYELLKDYLFKVKLKSKKFICLLRKVFGS